MIEDTTLSDQINSRITPIIQRLLATSSLKQYEIARECGFSKKYITQLNTGKAKPTVDRLAVLCIVLDVPMQDIVFELVNGFAPRASDAVGSPGKDSWRWRVIEQMGKMDLSELMALHDAAQDIISNPASSDFGDDDDVVPMSEESG